MKIENKHVGMTVKLNGGNNPPYTLVAFDGAEAWLKNGHGLHVTWSIDDISEIIEPKKLPSQRIDELSSGKLIPTGDPREPLQANAWYANYRINAVIKYLDEQHKEKP